MTDEAYCANQLRLLESEHFIAIGDANVAQTLNPAYFDDLRLGKAQPLPDLLSVKTAHNRNFFRIREVKYKLEDRLIKKALRQLASGLEWLSNATELPIVDRIEIVLPLRDRRIKAAELKFLGTPLNENRFELDYPENDCLKKRDGGLHLVTVLLL